MSAQKTLDVRLEALRTALRAIQLTNNNFWSTGDHAYMVLLAGQLRALIAQGGSSMTPLLLNLATELNIPLTLFSWPDKPAMDNGAFFHAYMGKSWSSEQKEPFIPYTLDAWMLAPSHYLNTVLDYRNRNQILKQIANKEGGSHYDDGVSQIIEYLQSITKGDYPSSDGSKFQVNGLQLFLSDVSEATFWLGRRLLRIHHCRENGLHETDDHEVQRLDRQFSVPPPEAAITIF